MTPKTLFDYTCVISTYQNPAVPDTYYHCLICKTHAMTDVIGPRDEMIKHLEHVHQIDGDKAA